MGHSGQSNMISAHTSQERMYVPKLRRSKGITSNFYTVLKLMNWLLISSFKKLSYELFIHGTDFLFVFWNLQRAWRDIFLFLVWFFGQNTPPTLESTWKESFGSCIQIKVNWNLPCFWYIKYRKVTSINTSRLEASSRFYRLIITGKFNV